MQPGVDIIEPLFPGERSGSSALLGALAALKIGYRRIILCGCPLDEKKYQPFQIGWIAKEKVVKGKVFSMSGWTKELLGAPGAEWMENE
jgi:hypothetical protein